MYKVDIDTIRKHINFYDDRLTLEELSSEITDEDIKKAFEKLDNRKKKILYLRFEKNLSLEEVGKEFDVTRERIRQMSVKAIRKICDDILASK